ncbi:MAG: imidazole glycerol phosphate synthase subunit HisH [Acidobacteria bacterium]|nr:imidazole glycerol phosphate synthase subunit HisH [Acidobacteriota bacterium]
MITIIDYGVGNLRSVEKAFAAMDIKVQISSDKEVLEEAEALVLPGVGAFGDAMLSLKTTGFDKLIIKAAKEGKPILGICLGFQLLFEESEEFGTHKGLGLLAGKVIRFPENDLSVPHVGWNQIHKTYNHPLLSDISSNTYFYFVHSFYVQPSLESDLIASTSYGINFSSIAGRDNVVGAQFHPEKSQLSGLTLLKNFATRMVNKC